MKLVDEIFEMYKGKIRGSQEDLDMIAFTILEQLDHTELLEMVKELNEDELAYFIRLYIVESLKGRLELMDDSNTFYH
ncbi:hypothetical protein JMA_25420 [Jeotgalibacillus malaysiensis]|uniref:Uncharacterized protein n=1 Tax=Jeotgalibacillus malaysiensis TaxID=1508404 RepID=A0A0B5AV43_9BACL|nr:DUF6154 family protein [Jeotgalibacillus malaysiensis]AJD91859.1 hypothetical protein JMA_25420 [Jeotgalibacillus malaysiensis]